MLNVLSLSLVLLLSLPLRVSFAAEEAPQTFTLDGRLYSDSAATIPLADVVSLKVQILDPAQTCIVYEEVQSVNTTATSGYYTIQIGQKVTPPAGKRSSGDSNNGLTTIFSNSVSGITGKLLSDGTTVCTYNPTAGDTRYVKFTMTPTGDNIARTTTSNLRLDSVPMALVAERAENLRGLTPSQLLQVNGTTASLTQTNLENIFSTLNYPNLVSLLATAPANYVLKNSNGSTNIPSVAGAPGSGLAVGQIWYDSTNNQLKYYDGAVKVVGSSTAGTLAATAGGTGQSSFAVGDLLYANTTTALARLPASTSGYVLTSNGAGTAPSWQAAAGGGGSLSSMTAATTTNSINNANFAQSWNWNSATTESPLTLTSNAITTGSLLNLTSSSAGINSTNGLLNVANSTATTTGTLARFQANSTAGSGMTILNSGAVGIGTASPASTALLTVNGAISTNSTSIILGNTSGNARGAISVDIQSSRSTASQVAAGVSSIAVGINNSASGANAGSTAIGYGNTAFSDWWSGAVAIGNSNNSSGSRSIAIGTLNNSGNWDLGLTMGIQNTIGGANGIGIGFSNWAGPSTIAIGSGVSNSTWGSLQIGPSDAAKMTISSAGNVGIGTTGPDTKLHIAGTAGTTLKVVDGNQGAGKVLTSDANGVASWQAPASVVNKIQNVRLTLTSGLPITISNEVGATNLYVTPFRGDILTFYDGGTTWTNHTFTEQTIALSGLTAGNQYDVFCWYNTGVVCFLGPAWSSDTTRGTGAGTTEIVLQNGVYVNKNSISGQCSALACTYYGTIRATSSTTTEDGAGNRYVYNYYNRVSRKSYVFDVTTHTYDVATFRNWNNYTFAANPTKFANFIIGVVEDVSVITGGVSTDGTGHIAIAALNGTSDYMYSKGDVGAASFSRLTTTSQLMPQLGINNAIVQQYNGSVDGTTWREMKIVVTVPM